MKGDIRKKYQEYVNHIDFPIIIYVYETNKVVVLNGYAKEIVGTDFKDIRDLFGGKKIKLRKDVLNNSYKFFQKTRVYINGNENYIDMDISVYIVDNLHYVVMLFEYSYKNVFLSRLSIQVPRVSWRYEDSEDVFFNFILRSSKKEVHGSNYDVRMSNFFDEYVVDKIKSEGKIAIDEKVCRYSLVQMKEKNSATSSFIKAHIMPIICNKGECIGALCIYVQILSKEKNRELIDCTIKDNILLTGLMDKGNIIFIGWLEDEPSTIKYISSNIEKYGYKVEDFFLGRTSLKDIICEEDYLVFRNKIYDEKSISVCEYRIKKTTGEVVWVHEECIQVILEDNVVYNFSSLYDITYRKKLEKELERIRNKNCGKN